MYYYAVSYEYNPNNPEIEKNRPAHRKFISRLDNRGCVLGSGPHTDSKGGALIVLKFEKELPVSEVMTIMDEDPFFANGCITGRTFRAWNPVIGSAVATS